MREQKHDPLVEKIEILEDGVLQFNRAPRLKGRELLTATKLLNELIEKEIELRMREGILKEVE
jgi:hypothetical protein